MYDISLRFRGSSNQRLIDVPKSLAAGTVVPLVDKPVIQYIIEEAVLSVI